MHPAFDTARPAKGGEGLHYSPGRSLPPSTLLFDGLGLREILRV